MSEVSKDTHAYERLLEEAGVPVRVIRDVTNGVEHVHVQYIFEAKGSKNALRLVRQLAKGFEVE